MTLRTEPATKEGLARLTEFFSSWAGDHVLDLQLRGKAELIIEELLVNMVSHAFAETGGEMGIDCRMDGSRLHLRVMDNGSPFDPTLQPAPDLTLSLEDRTAGGLGIFLVLKMADTVSYTRQGSQNILDIQLNHPEKEEP